MTPLEVMEYKEWVGHQFDKMTLKIAELECEIEKIRDNICGVEDQLNSYMDGKND